MSDQNKDQQLKQNQNPGSAVVARYVISLDEDGKQQEIRLKGERPEEEITLISSSPKPVHIQNAADPSAAPASQKAGPEGNSSPAGKPDSSGKPDKAELSKEKTAGKEDGEGGKNPEKRKVRLNKNFRGRSLTGDQEDLEEELSEEDLDREQMKWALKSRLRVYGLVAAFVLAFVLAAFLFGNYFRYQGYSSLASIPQASTASTSYAGMRDAVLTYEGEGATLMDLELKQIWNVQYTISSPAVSTAGDSIAIYDRQGSTIVLCDTSGERSTITTSYPLIKAKVSKMGSVAAIEKDGEVTWLEYFNPDGSRVASVRTSMDSTGYPLDMAVSDDGLLLAVSYISYDGEQKKGLLDFYQFGSTGQNQVDNRVAEFEYKDHFFPQVEFLGENRCVAFRDNGFSVFTADDVPAKVNDVILEDRIASVAYDESEFAILSSVTDQEGKAGTLVTLYNMDGNKIRDFDADISYNTVEMVGNEIDFYADNKLAVYSTGGVRKFEDTIEENTGTMFSVGNFRFGIVTDDSLNIIKLH